MPRVGFEPTIPVLKRAKAVDPLDSAATEIGISIPSLDNIESLEIFTVSSSLHVASYGLLAAIVVCCNSAPPLMLYVVSLCVV
jgi:hypothetical protein